MKLARNLAIVAVAALALLVAPGGGATLAVALTLLTIAFFVAIGFLGNRLYREYAFTLDSLASRERLVLYGSIGAAFLVFTATGLLFTLGGVGILTWIALLAACSYGLYWVIMRARRVS